MKYDNIAMAHKFNSLSPEKGNREFCVPKRLNYSVALFWYLL